MIDNSYLIHSIDPLIDK